MKLKIQQLLRIMEAMARKCSVKTAFLKKFAKFTGKHLHQILFSNKVPGLRMQFYLKKRL